MTARIAWMRGRTRVARHAKRAGRSGLRNFGGVRTLPAGTR
jgi:hypothetical protein